MKPNIFDISTKELSQDAFITWLLRWASPDNESLNKALCHCGQEFIRRLIGKRSNYQISKVSADRQWNQIDVWAKVNDEYLIIIEDKTFTGEHSNQLIRYKEFAQDWCDKNNFKLVPIYLKTGALTLRNMKTVESKGYSIFRRADFVALLADFNQVKNDIFIDFKARLSRIHDQHQFKSIPVSDWSSMGWIGFYQHLEHKNIALNWHYVNNQSNSFWNALLSWDHLGAFPIYLQIEQGKLCFKISTHEEDIRIDSSEFRRGVVRNFYHKLIIEKAEVAGLTKITRPARFGSGTWMTIANVGSEDWLESKNGLIDISKTIKNLKMYKNFLDGIKVRINKNRYS